ncbi:MAG: alkaline phosphatase D [Halioglobus sp.]|jgi:alkaline phosphatase D
MLALMSSGTFFLALPSSGVASVRLPMGSPPIHFPQGVASADPQANSIVLWTRAEPVEAIEAVKLSVQVALDDSFDNMVMDTLVHTDAQSDYTVRVYLNGLQPDTRYYYRFVGPNSTTSRLGQTRTAPHPDQAKAVSMAFASCQSYEQGYFGSWARMLEDDEQTAAEEKIQFVLHLGDFIYERSWHKRIDGSPQSRYIPPFPDGVDREEYRYATSLADYRHLYKHYLRDPALQAARARWPFICIWDDHEYSNDNFQSYSHYDEEPLLNAKRKQDSNQAWSEFIPAVLNELDNQPAHGFKQSSLDGDDLQNNIAAADSLCIYRTINWGKHLDIVLTDTRSYRSGPCVDGGLAATLGLPMNSATLVEIADSGRDYNNGNPPQYLPYGDGTTANPAAARDPGTCLGMRQRTWFTDTITASTATWKLWGNALPIMPLQLDLSSLPFAGLEDGVFNVDAWGGYPSEVKYLMDHFASNGVEGLVSFSGDHHLHGAATVYGTHRDATSRPVIADFACAGISSSPLFGDILAVAEDGNPDFQPMVYAEPDDPTAPLTPVFNMTMVHGVLAAATYAAIGLERIARWLGPNEANKGLKFVDVTANGYGLARFTQDQLQVELITMEDLTNPFEAAPNIKHRSHFELDKWTSKEGPVLNGPVFSGGAPFPFEPPTV